MRIPALLSGIITPLVVYWFGRRVLPRLAAFGLGLLFAIHFPSVVHSGEARGYAASSPASCTIPFGATSADLLRLCMSSR